MLIPGSNEIKARVDVAAVGTAGLAWFKAIPWPEIAACLAALYTLVRLIEFLIAWWKGRRSHG